MEANTVRRVCRFRQEPTVTQAQRLRQYAGARRWVWNRALQQRLDYYRQTGQTLSAKELSARLTALKDQPETAWLREIDSQLLQQVLADLQRAYVNFFERRARYPRFKSRKRDRARFRFRDGKTTDGGAPRRSKNPTALAVWSVNVAGTGLKRKRIRRHAVA